MLILDTNAVLRYLLCDNEDMAKEVDEIICSNEIGITTEIIAEIIYVLTKVYSVPRKTIGEQLLSFSQIDNITIFDEDVFKVAIDYFVKEELDFVDCLLIGYKKAKTYDVFTFDKKLKKLLMEK